MMTALDGKITGKCMNSDAFKSFSYEYERTNAVYHPDAWLCGRKTLEEQFTTFKEPILDESITQVPDGDFVAVDDAKMYYVSVDIHGRVGWESNTVKHMDRPVAHVIQVLTKSTSASYKAFLRSLNISYIIAGKQKLDLVMASEKLYRLFGIKTLMVSGGGIVNWSFLKKGLVDEFSLILAPVADGDAETPSLFEAGEGANRVMNFTLNSVEVLSGDNIWLRYKVRK